VEQVVSSREGEGGGVLSASWRFGVNYSIENEVLECLAFSCGKKETRWIKTKPAQEGKKWKNEKE
jgi:hypothetical protein